jgi:hypothetical protein
MSAIKATAYAIPLIFAFSYPSFAAFHGGGGHIGGGHMGGFRGGGAFHAGALTMASQAGTVVSLTADDGGFAARSNMKRVYAPFTINHIK